MALQRVAGNTGSPAGPAAIPTTQNTAVSAGPALSTRETTNRPFVELGVMFGQALGGREPVMQALTNLQNIGGEHGCDAIVAVKLLHYPTTAGPAVVAYGTGVRFLPNAPENGAVEGSGVLAMSGGTMNTAGSAASSGVPVVSTPAGASASVGPVGPAAPPPVSGTPGRAT